VTFEQALRADGSGNLVALGGGADKMARTCLRDYFSRKTIRRGIQMRMRLLTLVIAMFVCTTALVAEGETPKPDKDGWYNLFNGKDLTGWKVTKENPDTFKVEDGQIVAHGDRAHLFYVGPVNNGKFKDFDWKCEIMTKPHSNSGMYFHTEYQPEDWPSKGLEIQVNNTHPDPRKTGSVYALKDVMNNSPAKDNEWFTQEVIVRGRHIVVKVNGKVVNDYTLPEKVERRGGFNQTVQDEGTFALQGHDPGSETHYRKVMVKPLP
jgi:hypothetical protein